MQVCVSPDVNFGIAGFELGSTGTVDSDLAGTRGNCEPVVGGCPSPEVTTSSGVAEPEIFQWGHFWGHIGGHSGPTLGPWSPTTKTPMSSSTTPT
jgi:hypothetical protein